MDALKLADIIAQITTNLTPYRTKYREIVESNGGQIDKKTGAIFYKDEKLKNKAEKELNDIGEIEIEYHGDRLTINDDWPKLSLQEARILSFILENPS